MPALIETIVAALHLLAFTGECAGPEYYPTNEPELATGYAVIDDCAIPTVPAMPAGRQCQIYAHLTGETDIACRGGELNLK